MTTHTDALHCRRGLHHVYGTSMKSPQTSAGPRGWRAGRALAGGSVERQRLRSLIRQAALKGWQAMFAPVSAMITYDLPPTPEWFAALDSCAQGWDALVLLQARSADICVSRTVCPRGTRVTLGEPASALQHRGEKGLAG
ncbi:MAG: hypothetical protein JWO98_1260 [Frankiales bacterium]|nr:hypothetical protein [Frankiales bacterium]